MGEDWKQTVLHPVLHRCVEGLFLMPAHILFSNHLPIVIDSQRKERNLLQLMKSRAESVHLRPIDIGGLIAFKIKLLDVLYI